MLARDRRERATPCARCKAQESKHEVWGFRVCPDCAADWYHAPEFCPKAVCGALGLNPSAPLSSADSARETAEYQRRTQAWVQAGYVEEAACA